MKIIQKQVKSIKNLEVVFLKSRIKGEKTLKNNNFNGNNGELCISGNKLYVGIKNIKEKSSWRELGFKITNYLKDKVKEFNVNIPLNSKEIIEGFYLGIYQFDKYKSNPKSIKLKTINIFQKKNMKQIILKAKNKAYAQTLTRDLVNLTPEDFNSSMIEKKIATIFKKDKDIQIKTYKEKDLKKHNMNGHLSVNRASRHEAKTIKIEYIPKNIKNPETIVLVGKGLTYDSGGLSLKPAQHMLTMKSDKAGAMTVLGIMKV